MPRPNDGKVANNGVFILDDWGAVETLSRTFAAFSRDGSRRLDRMGDAQTDLVCIARSVRLACCAP